MKKNAYGLKSAAIFSTVGVLCALLASTGMEAQAGLFTSKKDQKSAPVTQSSSKDVYNGEDFLYDQGYDQHNVISTRPQDPFPPIPTLPPEDWIGSNSQSASTLNVNLTAQLDRLEQFMKDIKALIEGLMRLTQEVTQPQKPAKNPSPISRRPAFVTLPTLSPDPEPVKPYRDVVPSLEPVFLIGKIPSTYPKTRPPEYYYPSWTEKPVISEPSKSYRKSSQLRNSSHLNSAITTSARDISDSFLGQ